MSARTLTVAQHLRLDRLASEFPGAQVVGWMKDSPIVRHDTGYCVRVAPSGRIVVLHRAPSMR